MPEMIAFTLQNRKRRLIKLKAIDREGQPFATWPTGATVTWTVNPEDESELQWSNATHTDGTPIGPDEQWARGKVVGTALGHALPVLADGTPIEGVDFSVAVGNSELAGVGASVSEEEDDPEDVM